MRRAGNPGIARLSLGKDRRAHRRRKTAAGRREAARTPRCGAGIETRTPCDPAWRAWCRESDRANRVVCVGVDPGAIPHRALQARPDARCRRAVSLRIEKSKLERAQDRLDSGSHAKAATCASDMVIDSSRGDVEDTADVGGAFPLANPVKAFPHPRPKAWFHSISAQQWPCRSRPGRHHRSSAAISAISVVTSGW